MAPYCLNARNITKRYSDRGDETLAFENVSFTVRKGEFCAIVGPSGCGKTTLLRTLAGLETVTAGELDIHVTKDVASHSAISLVFQENSLFPWMTLQQNIAFLLQEKVGKSQAVDIALGWLSTLGLEKFSHYYPHQVSGGMRQRVAIARSFAVEPALLLMDEPFVFIDDLTRSRLHAELEKLWRAANNTVMFVTHDIEEAVLLADRVLVFSPHPGTISNNFTIDIERPRVRSILREDTRFTGIVKEITGLLHDLPV